MNAPVAGFDTDRETFLGLYNGWSEPQVAAKGESANSVRQRLVARSRSHGLDVTLAPGEEKTFVFMLGYVENPRDEKWEKPGSHQQEARRTRCIAQFSTPEQVDAALTALRDHWTELLSNYSVEVARREAEPDGQHLEPVPVHGHVQHVALAPRTSRRASAAAWASATRTRTCSGFVHLVPERARERIIDIASTQFPDGSAYHQYQPLTKRGNNDVGSGFNDDPLWLIFGVAAYIKETGDYGDPRRAGAVRQRPEDRRRRCSST